MIFSIAPATPAWADVDISHVRGTILYPRLPWYRAHADGLPLYKRNYFHRQVQEHIRATYKSSGIRKGELSIPGSGPNGGTGFADLYMVCEYGFIYLWDVKTAYRGSNPDWELADLRQIERYITAGIKYDTEYDYRSARHLGARDPIPKTITTFTVYDPVFPRINGRYTVSFHNAGNGLIFYRFDPIDEEDDNDDTYPSDNNQNNENQDSSDQDDQDGTAGDGVDLSNVIELPWLFPLPGHTPEDQPSEQPAASTPCQQASYEVATELANFIIETLTSPSISDVLEAAGIYAGVIYAIITWENSNTTIQPSAHAIAFLAGEMSPHEFLNYMNIVLGFNPELLRGFGDDAVGGGVSFLEYLYGVWSRIVSPLAINLDGTGIETIS